MVKINKRELRKLIEDVQDQLQANENRLNFQLNHKDKSRIIEENQAISNTIAKLENDLDKAVDIDTEALDYMEIQTL